MLPELREVDATGETARIYAEIRDLWRVPYVSSMQRFLATQGDWLPWAWSALGPIFRNGEPQHTAWQIARTMELEPLPELTLSAARVMGLGAEDCTAISEVCFGYVRVSPVNLMMGGMLRRLVLAEASKTEGALSVAEGKPLPEMLPEPPPLVAVDAMSPELLATLDRLGADVAGTRFIPGLYRHLAHWPVFAAYAVTLLDDRLHRGRDGGKCLGAAMTRLADEIDAAAGEILGAHFERKPLPRVPFADAECTIVIEAISQYRRTSPEMVVFGRMLAESLPGVRLARPAG
jgi:hypothetical protein